MGYGADGSWIHRLMKKLGIKYSDQEFFRLQALGKVECEKLYGPIPEPAKVVV